MNAKSIRVHIMESRSMFGRKEKSHWELDQVVTYRFSKTLENGNAYYKSESGLYGGIEI